MISPPDLPRTSVFSYYKPEEPDASGGERVEFRLIYQGPLPAEKCEDKLVVGSGGYGRAKDKHRLRKHFHLQLRELWQQHPDLRMQAEQKFIVHYTPSNQESDPGPDVRQIQRVTRAQRDRPDAKSWLDHVADNNIRCNGNRFVPLSREPAELELFYDAVGSELASLTKRKLDHFGLHMDLSEKVKISTIDAYCSDHQIDHIDLLKVDVEGHELDVLDGGKRMFSRSAIDMVTFEFGGCNIDTRTFFQDFFYFFHDHQMRIARITPAGYLCELQSYQEVFEQFRTTNFMCYRR